MYRLPIFQSMPTNDPKHQKVNVDALYNFGKMVSEGPPPPIIQCQPNSVTVNNEATDGANDTKSCACDICAKADVCKYQDEYRSLFNNIKNESEDITRDNPFTLQLKCDKFSDIYDVY